MPRVHYVNVADRPQIIPAEVGDVPDGDVIWNAPRPLYGTKTWTGEFVCGSLYAAGPRERFERANEQLDAVEIRFVTNEQIAAMVDERLAADGYSRDDYAEIGMDIAEIAAHYQLPWVP